MHDLILGIDAGGSTTNAWLARSAVDKPVVLAKGEAGPGNPLSAGWENSLANLDIAIKNAFSAGKLDAVPVTRVCLSIAGGDRESVRERLVEWLTINGIAKHIQVTNDAFPLLFAGCPHGVGIAVIAGTGSIVYGRDATNQTGRCGGWGHLIGDEGSAYWITIQALKAITDAEDGKANSSRLTPSFLNYTDSHSVSELIGKVYGCESKKEIAGWAHLVFSCRDQGDPRSIRIVQEAAAHLARQIQTVVGRLQFGATPLHLALAGGIMTNQPDVPKLIVAECENRQLPIADYTLVDSPAWGAVLMAQQNT